MKPLPRLWLGVAAAGITWLSGCADGPPTAPAGRPSLDVVELEDAGPDSGAVVVQAWDGPAWDGGAGAYGSAVAGAGAEIQAMSATVAATAGPQPLIRIGVVRDASEITLGSSGAYTLYDRANGLVLLSGMGGTVTVTLASATTTNYRLQVMCGSATAVATRKAAAEALGHPTLTEFVASANCTRLYLGEFASNASFTVRNNYRNLVISQGLAASDSFWKLVTIGSGTLYSATNGTTTVQSVNPLVLESATGLVTIGGKVGGATVAALPYRGRGEVRQSGTGLAGINELPVEQYLYGVLPRELGPVQYPEIEAQKAQAVAARTYAMEGIATNKRGSDGYHLRATTDDQVYGGYSAEHPVSTGAVDATAGVVATYGGKLISALFSSTSGGHTADNEEAFNAAAAPYLRGVPDAERGAALAHVPTLEVFRARADAASLRAAREGDFESDWARYHRWTFEWTMEEITQVVSAYAGQDVGRVLAIDVLQRGPSGRVLEIAYVTEAGRFTDTRDHIRSSLKYINASGTPTNLLSTLFFVEPVRDAASQAVTGYRAYGGGFGHGVGLSQTGAVGMAQKGHAYEEILKHYYQGITLGAGY